MATSHPLWQDLPRFTLTLPIVIRMRSRISQVATIMSGISDVALNNATAWSKVTTTKNVNDLSTITISLDSSITSNHFNGQSIYGIVNTLKDKSGNQFINFPSI